MKSFTPLNTLCELIWCEVFQLHNMLVPQTPKVCVIGYEPDIWYNFHKVKGHHTKECYQLKKENEQMIQEGPLKKYVKGDPTRGSGGSNSRGWDDAENPRSRK